MKIQIRADSVVIEGYVNAVGRDSRKLTDEYGYPFVEQITPGVFGRALSEAKNQSRAINVLLDHDTMHKIGDTDTNAELEEDTIGLYAVVETSDPDTMQAARDKKLRGWSFGFREMDYKESYAGDCPRRSITELELIEVSVIDDKMTPCYAGTSIRTRADEGKETIYVRSLEDDKVEYQENESCTGTTDPEGRAGEDIPEQKPEESNSGQQADEAPGQQAEERASKTKDKVGDAPDLSVYRNKIRLLNVKGGF